MDDTFHEYVANFHIAFAEDAFQEMCEALHNMRAFTQTPTSHSNDFLLHLEILGACELKALSKRTNILNQFRQLCQSSQTFLQTSISSFLMCIDLKAIQFQDENLTLFRIFLSKHFENQATHLYQSLCQHKSQNNCNEHGYIDRNVYVQAQSELIRNIIDIFEIVNENLKEYADGSDIIEYLFTPIHAICVEFTLENINLFTNEARILAWERKASDYAQRQAMKEEIMIEMDESLQMLDLFLDEMVCILRLLSSYQKCLKSAPILGNEAINKQFQGKYQELNGVYLLLERFYIFQSIHKATEIAEVQALQNQIFVSSMVEDTFFVLYKVTSRCSQSLCYHNALSVISALADVLESTYLAAILELPNRDFHISLEIEEVNGEVSENRSFSDLMQQAIDEDLVASAQTRAKLFMAINSAYCSQNCISTLVSKVNEMSSAIFPEHENILDCVPKPLTELTVLFEEIVQSELTTIVTSMKAQMEPLLYDCLERKCKYHLSAAEYDAFGIHPSPLIKFLDTHISENESLRQYQRTLCPESFQILVQIFTMEYTNFMEHAILQIRFSVNELGALQLEREISDMLDRLSRFGKKSLRSSFTRLFHMILVLNLLRPRDLVSSYEPMGRERLEEKVIEMLMKMRVEFEVREIEEAMRDWREKREKE